jgi:hypothetical protein
MIKSSFCVYLFGLEALAQQRGFSFIRQDKIDYCDFTRFSFGEVAIFYFDRFITERLD